MQSYFGQALQLRCYIVDPFHAKLVRRSFATTELQIKDLQGEWTAAHYIVDPFHAEGYSACPKEHCTLRQLRRMGSGGT